MHSADDGAKVTRKVYEVILPEYPDRLQMLLFRKLFKDRCSKCGLPSYVEIGNLQEVELPHLSQDFGLACGFWMARKEFAQLLCTRFEEQFEMRNVSEDACFLILRNVLVPVDPFYEDLGDDDLTFIRGRDRICSVCGRPFIFLEKGFEKFDGENRIRSRTIYETSLKFGTGDVKYPAYFCDEEAAFALKAMSRKFKFVRSAVKFSIDAA